MNKKMKIVAILAALVLVIGVAAGSTLAWLTDKTEAVTNTFTKGDVDITLIETMEPDGTVVAGGVTDWSAPLIPGKDYSKNPTITVESTTNADCWLFVKFEEVNNASTYLSYTSTLTDANGWTQGNGTEIPDNVWYRKVKTDDTIKSWELLDGNKITVKGDTVTKDSMNEAANAKLIYTGYAIQTVKFDTASDAWTEISNPTP